MTGIIWYKTKQKGFMRLDELIEDYNKMNADIQIMQNNGSGAYIRFSNDDIWIVAPATDSSKARTSNIALIDNDIEQDIINKIIMPTLKLKPFQAYNFYDYSFELERGK